jgi:hypothetical protein
MAAGAIIGGSALSLVGKFKQMDSEAEAAQANAATLEEQARFFEFSSERELDIFNFEASQLIGEQEASFAKAGVDLGSSRSALSVLDSQRFRDEKERSAISTHGRIKAGMARDQAQQQRNTAASLNDPFNRLLIGGGTVLTASGSLMRGGK